MRLYTIYRICESNIENLMSFKKIYNFAESKYEIENWVKTKTALEQIYQIDAFKEKALKIYNGVPAMCREEDTWSIGEKESAFIIEIEELQYEVNGVIKVYQSFGFAQEELGIDIKMPQGDFNEFNANLKSLQFIFSQCPILKVEDSEIKFNNVDVGSTWLTFFLVGSGAVILAKNIAALVDKALILKSHLLILKQQEEVLRTSKIKNDLLESSQQTFDLLREQYIEQVLNDLESGDIKYGNPEERDKTKVSLEKLSELLDKGMEIHASIDSSKEIQMLFPPLETNNLLTDNLTKLLTTNQAKE